ncbi:MAG: hypothetical protein ACRD1T_11305, partial [Acidimicrobiia bacterium]
MEDFTSPVVTEETFRTLDGKGKQIAPTRWRLITSTGNCCENYLATTPDGRLLDFGGDWLRMSKDEGLTWQQVRAPLPLSSGEGAVTVTPKGDVVGVSWFPYFGDWLFPFKYEAVEETWYYTATKLHQPFYDRPAIAVLPGPFVVDGQRFAYLSMIRGGSPMKDTMLYSTDGLNYLRAGQSWIESSLANTVSKWLDLETDPQRDWVQPHEQAGITPLNGGEVLRGIPAWPDTIGPAQLTILGSDLRWRRFRLPRGALTPGRVYADSRGWLHRVATEKSSVQYRVSTNGGRTWKAVTVALPRGHTLSSDYWNTDWWASFRVNGHVGVAALTLHAIGPEGNNQDLMFKFRVT